MLADEDFSAVLLRYMVYVCSLLPFLFVGSRTVDEQMMMLPEGHLALLTFVVPCEILNDNSSIEEGYADFIAYHI